MATPPKIAGIPWYQNADYPRILQIMEDAHLLPAKHKIWQEKAEKAEALHKAQGVTIYRAHIDPEQFVAWCAQTGRNIDAKARIDWANLYAMRKFRGEN
ncbi:MAG TPA: hypothetical protein VFF98_17280 [Novosphingobium sp.]|nr:hypothetical protein [Novosphingobium sp.]HZV09085.1 hypothetical protein [Novosphingobium sp.]